MMYQAAKRCVKYLLVTQAVILSIAVCVVLIVEKHGLKPIVSVLLAGGCMIIPTTVAAIMTMRQTGAKFVAQTMRRFYRAEVVKFILTGGLMAVIFCSIPIMPLAFFATFIAMQCAYWIVLGCVGL